MKRFLIALTAGVLSLTTGVNLAAANPPTVGSQTVDQSASSTQAAGAASGAAQTNPSNTNISIRVLSPGNDGSVSQSNTVASNANASNTNAANQTASQTQASGAGMAACCPSGSTGIQTATQAASNEQAAAALSLATQTGASNTNVPIRVLSPGSDGSVSQTNSVDSDATARNTNAASQTADQTQSGGTSTAPCGCDSGSTGIQVSDQQADNSQAALAASSAKQENPENTNVSIRVLSPGSGGSVRQNNHVESDATATNSNESRQNGNQTQAGGAGAGSTGVQVADQKSSNEQLAIGLSEATQTGASNINTPIRVLSPGSDGNVSQSNSVDSDATAANRNSSDQNARQSQTGGSGMSQCCQSGSTGIQIAKQDADSSQGALAASVAKQEHPSNTNTPIRVKSPGSGGSVSQSNSVESDATAHNSNAASQSAAQSQSAGSSSAPCGCDSGSTGIQIAGQSASNEQLALGLSAAVQKDASNSNSPLRVLSPGSDGSVSQSNSVDSDATAANRNSSDQSAAQSQAGGSAGLGIQIAGQEASNHQGAAAASAALQHGASNDHAPLRVLSPGAGGRVSQSNSVESDADAHNSNEADQSAAQRQSSGPGTERCCESGATGIQVIGQSASNGQLAVGLSEAVQLGASNSNSPLRVLSPGSDGSVSQSNSVDSDARASNRNSSDQSATQSQSSGTGPCCGGSLGIQVIGQETGNHQGALALSGALQVGASNENSPLRVLSPGGDGSVSQSNSVDSDASARNRNSASQAANQTQTGGTGDCRCPSDSIGIQVIGQSSWSSQGALAASFAKQLPGRSPCGCPVGPSNVNDPVRVLSPGAGGRVSQSNSVESDATGSNTNGSGQSANQSQAGASGAQLGIQVAGQSARNHQLAAALSAALQLAPSNANGPLAVLSPGAGGSTSQANDALSGARGANRNGSRQSASQRAM